MTKYITVIDTDTITLDIMGRKKTFKNSEELNGNLYTDTYPQYFKKIGTFMGYGTYLAKPIFIPDYIEEFVQKEEKRKEEILKSETLETLETPEEVTMEEISDSNEIDVIFETEEQ